MMFIKEINEHSSVLIGIDAKNVNEAEDIYDKWMSSRKNKDAVNKQIISNRVRYNDFRIVRSVRPVTFDFTITDKPDLEQEYYAIYLISKDRIFGGCGNGQEYFHSNDAIWKDTKCTIAHAFYAISDILNSHQEEDGSGPSLVAVMTNLIPLGPYGSMELFTDRKTIVYIIDKPILKEDL